MGKGEIACYEQFLLFLQCFQKACFPGVSKGVIAWEWVNRTLWEKQKTLVKGIFLSPKCFQMVSFSRVVTSQDCVVKG